jgi:hypothetical protein
MNSKIASLKPHEYVDLRYQVSMQRKRDKYPCILYDINQSKNTSNRYIILYFKYRMVVK